MYFLSQLKAWKKLYTSGFETDFEYIRTLSYNVTHVITRSTNVNVKIDVTNYEVTAKSTNNLTIEGNGFITTVQKNGVTTTITAACGTVTGEVTNQELRNQILNVPTLIREAVYVIDNFTYTIDTAGRVARIECPSLTYLPTLAQRRRDGNLQAISNAGPARDGRGSALDNGGHMIAAIFNGPVELINYHAQQLYSNQNGDWKNLEKEWAAARQGIRYPANTSLPAIVQAITGGQTVKIDIQPQFSGNSKRPTEFIVDFWYNNVQQLQRTVTNP